MNKEVREDMKILESIGKKWSHHQGEKRNKSKKANSQA